jgi:hypothetical protein
MIDKGDRQMKADGSHNTRYTVTLHTDNEYELAGLYAVLNNSKIIDAAGITQEARDIRVAICDALAWRGGLPEDALRKRNQKLIDLLNHK